MHNPDFVKLADAMHCHGSRVSKLADLPAAITALLKHPGPAVLEALVEKAQHVYPMVAAGKTTDDMVLGPAGK